MDYKDYINTMHFSPDFINDLRSRLRISEVVGKRVKLQPKGRGEYTGLCCFHQEKTPSFSVSDNKDFYHCFGCGAHGDAIKFVMDTQGLNFSEAAQQLAQAYGVPLPAPDPRSEAIYEKRANLYDVLEAACAWMQKQLASSSAAAAARDYCTQRNLSSSIIDTFRLGYTPAGRDSLKKIMLDQNFTEKQLLDAGLIGKPEGAGTTYDRFRNRLMFPICDNKGRVVGFGGRILGDGQPKYLNSPDTELFHKGTLLYNQHLAREPAYKTGTIIAAEGYMDVIAMHRAGIPNAVAPLGTAITPQQLQLLWRMEDEPILCLDGDAAGKRAMTKVAEIALPLLQLGKSLKFTMLPPGKDPDDILSEQGGDALKQQLEHTIPLVELLWNNATAGDSINTPERKAALEKRLMDYADSISDPNVQNHYKRHFKDTIWKLGRTTTSKSFKSKKGTNDKNKKFPPQKAVPLPANSPAKHRYEQQLIATLLHHPTLLERPDIEEELLHLDLSDPDLERLRDGLISAVSSDQNIDEQAITKQLSIQNLDKESSTLLQLKTLDRFTAKDAPLHQALSGWNYTIAQLHHELLKDEHRALLGMDFLSEKEIIRAEALKKQKDVLKELAEKQKMAYLATLDD